MQTPKLKIPFNLWKGLIKELRLRGMGRRETGAFLLGPVEGSDVTEFICYNDLDPKAFDSGIIVFDKEGYIPLWEYCRNHNRKVLADIHTHPGKWTGQSTADKQHPMIAQRGHIAMIVPCYATLSYQTLKKVGLYEYLGDHKWKTWKSSSGLIEFTFKEKMREEITENNFNRLAGSLMQHYKCSYEEALHKLNSLKLNINCGVKIKCSYVLQAALITAVNSGKRAFLGGVQVNLPENVPCLIPWPDKTSLNEVIVQLGGTTNRESKSANFTLTFGLPANVENDSLEIICNGWQAGILNGEEESPIVLNENESLPLGGIAAGALGVGLAFLRVTGIDRTCGDVTTGISLWRPDLNWQDEAASGPAIQFLPKKYWILGLGHLGQSYLWNIGLLPYKTPNEVAIMLQDYDRVAEANWTSGLLCEQIHAGEYKTRICAQWLEDRGFTSRISERKFDETTKTIENEPLIALCGFDSASSRVHLEKSGFDLIVETALGGNLSLFDNIILHTFPEAFKSPEQIWEKELDEKIQNDEVLKQFAHLTEEKCGILAETLARKAISSSFVGAFAGALGIAELIRGLNGGKRYNTIVAQTRNLQHKRVVVHKTENYSIEIVRNGFIEITPESSKSHR